MASERGDGSTGPWGGSDLHARAAADGGLLERLRLRARVLTALRAELDGAGFIEVQTPKLSPAGDPAPHLASFSSRFHGPGGEVELWLPTSPEHHHKRLLAAGLERIYEIGPFFRDGELGPLHNPEFTGLEWYAAGDSVEDCMRRTERLVRGTAERVLGRSRFVRDGVEVDLGPAFRRLSVRDALGELAGVDAPADWEVTGLRRALAAAGIPPDADSTVDDLVNRALVARVEPALERLGPVFLSDYPAPMAALARLRPGAPEVAERFELFVGGLELCNGYGELTDADEQRRRFEQQRAERRRAGLAVPPLDEALLRALEHGLPNCAGNALGVDRLLMLYTGAERIEQVLAFPLAEELGGCGPNGRWSL